MQQVAGCQVVNGPCSTGVVPGKGEGLVLYVWRRFVQQLQYSKMPWQACACQHGYLAMGGGGQGIGLGVGAWEGGSAPFAWGLHVTLGYISGMCLRMGYQVVALQYRSAASQELLAPQCVA
jgi:hypothetical protein